MGIRMHEIGLRGHGQLSPAFLRLPRRGGQALVEVPMPAVRPSPAPTAVVVGGGFFGCSVAAALRRLGLDPVLLEASDALLTRASAINQARVHGGYHYPRSLMTAVRSRANYDRFRREYAGCIVDDFTKVYAVGRIFSKVSAAQFALFMQRVGAPLRPAPAAVRALFNPDLVEDVWIAEECAFDWTRLRDLAVAGLRRENVPVHLGEGALALDRTAAGRWAVTTTGGRTLEADWVFNCTYSMLNALRVTAGLPLIHLKHELTEMALIELPPDLQGISVTMMCGPFFSFMPYPPRGLHTLSHVRYTPHLHWHDRPGEPWVDPYERFRRLRKDSAFAFMAADASRYVPALRGCTYRDSIWEVKTVLPQSEADDGRPILFHHTPDAPRFISIMGGKIDNIFDVESELALLLRAAVA